MRKLFSPSSAIFWIGLVVVIYMFAILASETSKNYQLRHRADELETQIAKLQSEIEELGFRITYYKTDTYKERLAREKLNVQAPGESVVIIKDETPEKTGEPKQIVLETDEQIESRKPNYQQWWDFLFGG
jgi:cell division protein FtsB